MVNQGNKKPSSSKATREEKGKGMVVYEKKKRAASEVKNEDVEIGEIKAPKKKLTNDDYIDAFHKCEFVQSNWGCKDSLEKLGLLDDMMLLLKNVGLDMVLDMKHQIFPREVAQLMGSFELVLNKNLGCAIEDLGMVRFFVNGFGYKLSIKKLCEAYGFKKTCNTKHKANASKDGLVWAIIGKGDYHPGHIQAANIANPVIRYAHKLIASTIFAREEGDKVKEAEIALLVNGIKPFIEERLAKDGIVGYEDLNLGVMLAKRILYLKNSWVLKPSKSSKRVYIGGFLTPLLKACKVPLSFPSPKPCKIIDVNHLSKTHFLVGRKGESYVYSFFDSNGDNQWVLLPNQEITSVTSWLNIRFKKGEKATFKEAIDPKQGSRRKLSWWMSLVKGCLLGVQGTIIKATKEEFNPRQQGMSWTV